MKKKIKVSDLKQPRQPIGFDDDDTVRFKRNTIVRALYEACKSGEKFTLGDVFEQYQTGQFVLDDLVQFYQLIGYSVSGFGELSFVPKKEIDACDAIASKVIEEAK